MADTESSGDGTGDGFDSLKRDLKDAFRKAVAEGMSFFLGGRDATSSPELGFRPEPGLVIAEYRLEKLIGQGGMGQVWEATQISLNRAVALKVVRPERVSERNLRLFAREARAGGRLAHSHIVTVYDHGESEGVHWIAMELVEGGWTLGDFLVEMNKREHLSSDYYTKVARFMVKLASAIQTAHDAGVIHRDLKPRNVLINSDDQPKLTDFGLAKITDETSMTQTGDFAGTYYYMSPEQVTAGRIRIDHRTDIFSLGVLLYEMLALRRPFEGDTTHQVADQIVSSDPPRLHKVRSRVPRDLAVICGKAMEKGRDRRYQRMEEFAEDLERYLNDRPIVARPPSTLQRGVKWIRRHPAATSSLALVVLFLVTFFAYVFLWHVPLIEGERDRAQRAETGMSEALEKWKAATRQARDEAARAVAERQARERQIGIMHGMRLAEKSQTVVSRNPGLALLLGLEGHRYDPSAASRTAMLRALSECRERRTLIHDGPVHYAAFSPDGTKVLTASADRTARIWDVLTGREIHRLVGHEALVGKAAFTSDGKNVLTASRDGTVRTWSTSTGRQVEITRVSTDLGRAYGSHWFGGINPPPEFSPNGDRWIWAGETSAFLCDSLGLQAPKKLVLPEYPLNGFRFSPLGRHVLTVSGGHLITASPFGQDRHQDFERIRLRLWRTAGGSQIAEIKDFESDVSDVQFSADGRHFLAAAGHTCRLFDTATGNCLHSVTIPFEEYERNCYTHLSPSLETRLQAEIERYRKDPNTSPYRILSARIHPSRPLVVLKIRAGHDAILWNYERETITLCADSVDGNEILVFSPDGRFILSSASSSRVDDQGLLRLNRVDDRKVHSDSIELRGHEDSVKSATFSPDGRIIVTASEDGTARIWRVQASDAIVTLRNSWHIDGPVFHPRGGIVATCGSGHRVTTGDNTVRLWNSRTGELLKVLSGHERSVLAPDFSDDGGRIVSPSRDGTARVWNTDTGQVVQVLSGHEDSVASAVFAGNRDAVLTRSEDGTVRLWDVESGRATLVIDGLDRFGVNSAVDSRGTKVLLSNDDRTWVVELAGGRTLVEFPERLFLKEASFSPSGDRVLLVPESYGNDGRSVFVRETETESPPIVLVGHEKKVNTARFSPDGRSIVTASDDKTVILWDVASGARLKILRGHEYAVVDAGFSPDGLKVVSSSSVEVKVWDLETAREEISQDRPDSEIIGSFFAPGGERILTHRYEGREPVGPTGVIEIWHVDPLPSAVKCAPRALTFSEKEKYRVLLPGERTASQLVDSLFSRLHLKSRVLDALKTDSALDDTVRTYAERIASGWNESTEQINRIAWNTAVRSDLGQDDYQMALEYALRACELQQQSSSYRITLGLAYYRVGSFPEALNALSRSGEYDNRGYGVLTRQLLRSMISYRRGDAEKGGYYWRQAVAELLWADLMGNHDDIPEGCRHLIGEAMKRVADSNGDV